MNMNADPLAQHVLIAEDDQDDFDLLSEAINCLPLKVIVSRAENGDILMRLVNENMPDILFLDLLLPCRDGMTCINEIRGDRRFDQLPIVVYTSLKDLDTIEFCFRSGSNLYVVKPQSYTDIHRIVDKVFSINWTLPYKPAREEYVITS
jgi:CheY-like chemotaxis protein